MNDHTLLQQTSITDDVEDLPLYPSTSRDYLRMWMRKAWHLTPRCHGRSMVRYTVYDDATRAFTESFRCRKACGKVRF